MENLINIDVTAAYNGDTDITLAQAIARIAAEFYDPQMMMNQHSGAYEERNTMAWSQKIIIQSIANAAKRQLSDTNTNKDGRPRGLEHQLDRARNYTKSLAMTSGGGEIDLEALARAASWIERLEAEVSALTDTFDTAAAVYEAVTGEDFVPYTPWEKVAPKQPSSGKAAEIKQRLALLGIDMDGQTVAQTNGVDTNERDVA